MNALDMLTEQHHEAEDLVELLADCHDAELRQRVLERLAQVLVSHLSLEENHFYPYVRTPDVDKVLSSSIHTHIDIRKALSDILDLSPETPEFEAHVSELYSGVMQHIDEEEILLFPKLSRTVSPDELENLGNEMIAAQRRDSGMHALGQSHHP